MHVTVIIPAGGLSTRYTSNKLLAIIQQKPVIMHSILAFINHPKIANIIIPCHESTHSEIASLTPNTVQFVPSGNTRAASVKNGVFSCSNKTTHVMIHDAARPAIRASLIDRILHHGIEYDAVIPGIPVSDTIKVINKTLVQETLPRESIRAIQTPQLFRIERLIDAYNKIKQIDVHTDEASLMEALNRPVHVIDGCPTNVKLTHPHQWAELNHIMNTH